MLSRGQIVAMILAAVVLLMCGAVKSDPALYRTQEVREPTRTNVEYRLKSHWKPTHYKLSLIPFIPENFTFSGKVEITFTALKDVDTICLHQDRLQLDNTTMTVEEVGGGKVARGSKKKGGYKVVRTWEDKERHFYFIDLGNRFKINTSYVLSINYTGTLGEELLGFYRGSYKDADNKERWYATTQFEPTYARQAFPCFDEPALKAKFVIRISRLGNMTSISNMPQDGEPVKHLDTPDGVGRVWDTFQETPLMSTYVVAFVVSDFAHLSDAKAKLRTFANTPTVELTRYALEVSPPILAWFEDFTGIKFALPKMDEVALTMFASGAMENWGLVTYREELFLFDKEVTTTLLKQRITCIISHEYAHQWFGNLVTLDWWSHVWLNEGFATYFETFAVAGIEKSWRLEEQFVVSELQSAMSSDDTTSTRAMTYPAESPADIRGAFDAISYAKGGTIIRMMEHVISRETLKKGLGNYLKDRSYSTGTPAILFSHLSKQFHEDNPKEAESVDLTEVMKTWTELKGFPVITVKRDYNTSSIKVTQAQFRKMIYKYTLYDPEWFVPLTFTSQKEANFSTATRLWLKPKNQGLVIPNTPSSADQWILFNTQVTGYYRVNYDDKNWEMLSAFLNSDKFSDIPAVNRAQLIDDSFSLARAGLQSYCLPLGLIRYLKRETDYIPWMSAINWIRFLHGKLHDSPGSAPLKKWLLDLVTPAYESVGFEGKASDDHVTKLLRNAMVFEACFLGHPECEKKALKEWEDFRFAPTTMDVDIRPGVYCTAVRLGKEAQWSTLWDEYWAQKTTRGLKDMIFSVIGCVTNATLHDMSLWRAMDTENVNAEEGPTVLASIMKYGDNDDMVLEFFIKNFDKMDQKYWLFEGILPIIAHYLKTPSQLVKLEELLATVGSDQHKKKAVEEAIKRTKLNMAWQERTGRLVVAWARDEGGNKVERDCRVTEDPKSEMSFENGRQSVKSAGCDPQRAAWLILAALWGSRRV